MKILDTQVATIGEDVINITAQVQLNGNARAIEIIYAGDPIKSLVQLIKQGLTLPQATTLANKLGILEEQ